MKLIAGLLGALGLLVLVVIGLAGGREIESAAEPATRDASAASFVAMRRIDARGELRSTDSISVGSPAIRRVWNFTVTSIAEEGIEVAPDTALVSFDTQKLSERLELQLAQLEQSRKELEKTTLEQHGKLDQLRLEQVELLAKQAKIAQQLDVPADLRGRLALEKLRIDADLAEKEVKLAARRVATQERLLESRIGAAESRITILETDIAQLRESVAKMTVGAPRAGFVVHVPDWNGEKVKVGDSVWHGRQIIEIANLNRMEVAAEIAEPDAGFVTVGQRVELRLDASPDRTFTGRVESLGRLFHPRSWQDPSMIFDAVVSIDDPDPQLMRPGMAADVQIIIEETTAEMTHGS